MMTPEEKLCSLGFELPPPPVPAGNYVPARITGNFLYLSGQGARQKDGSFITGRLGDGFSSEDGYQASRNAALQLLAAARQAVGELSRIKAVIRIYGMTNATPDYTDHASVINGCSDLFADVFGDAGCAVRSVAGMSSLPFGMPVQIEAMFLLNVRTR